MSLICPHCGADNRPQAKFCLKCATQLVALAPSPEEDVRAARRRKRRRRQEAEQWAAEAASESAQAMAEAHARSRLRWAAPAALLTAGLAALAIAGILWSKGPTKLQAPEAGGNTVAATPPPAASAPPRSAENAMTVAAAAPASQAAVLAAGAAASAALSTPAPAQPVAVRHPDVPRAAMAPARPASKPSRRAPERPPAAPEVAPVSAPPTPPAPSPPPPAPSGALCADRAFLSRAVCLQAECSKPGLRQHPSCVRMREQQEVLRHGSGGG